MVIQKFDILHILRHLGLALLGTWENLGVIFEGDVGVKEEGGGLTLMSAELIQIELCVIVLTKWCFPVLVGIMEIITEAALQNTRAQMISPVFETGDMTMRQQIW